MKKPKKSTLIILGLAALAYLFWRQKSALASPAVIGGNKLPLGDLSTAINSQAAVSAVLDATLTRQKQQEDILAQDKKIYEQMNPGHTYETDFPLSGSMPFMQ